MCSVLGSVRENVSTQKTLKSHVFWILKKVKKITVVTEDGMTYLFTSADDNNVDDDMMMMMMMCPHVSS